MRSRRVLPKKTDEPFHFSYKYTRKEFGDWPNRRILAPAPFIAMLAPSDEESLPQGPSWLGPLLDIHCHGSVELPGGYRPELPAAVHLKRDFAQYDATYEFKDGRLVSERHLKTLLQEVPTAERAQYKQFTKAVFDDYSEFISLSSGSTSSLAANKQDSRYKTVSDLRNLPDSQNEEANRLEDEARDEVGKRDSQSAVSSLYRAVSLDPKFTRAWVMLGGLLLMQKQKEAGLDAFHKAMAADPEQAAIPKALGWSLMASSQFEDAVQVWQDYVKGHSDDLDGQANLGNCLARLKRYSEFRSGVGI